MGVIYVRPNLINGKKYVGQATNLKTRQNKWKSTSGHYAGKAIDAARKKYGIDNFGFEILKECDDKELDFWEKYYIKELNTKVPYGYNMTDGGEGMNGCPVSQETRKKLSECHKGKHRSEETKRKISEGHKGKKLSEETRKKLSEIRKGRKHTDEQKRKIGEAHRGMKRSEETKRKISEGHKGLVRSDEWRRKQSEAHSGKKHHMYGKHLSEETRKKISDAHKNGKCSKPVIQINTKTDEIIRVFPSAMEVKRQLGYNQGNIIKCCKGERKTCGGYKWQYK